MAAPREHGTGGTGRDWWYAVHRGRRPGVYRTWAEAEPLVRGFAGAVFRKCPTHADAEAFVRNGSTAAAATAAATTCEPTRKRARPSEPAAPLVPPAMQGCTIETWPRRRAPPARWTAVDVYTDGACRGNGRPGCERASYAAWIDAARHVYGLVPTPPRATNQRAEVYAIVCALDRWLDEVVRVPHQYLRVYTDSLYALQAITRWMPMWRRNQWRTRALDSHEVLHRDLFERIQAHLDRHPSNAVEFWHVRGHANVPGNEVGAFVSSLSSSSLHVHVHVPPIGPPLTVDRSRRSR